MLGDSMTKSGDADLTSEQKKHVRNSWTHTKTKCGSLKAIGVALFVRCVKFHVPLIPTAKYSSTDMQVYIGNERTKHRHFLRYTSNVYLSNIAISNLLSSEGNFSRLSYPRHVV